jgi:alpha-L-rhamnosidase
MASAIGKDASVYEHMQEEARSYIRDSFMTSEGLFKTQLLNTMQTPALFALKAGVVEGDARTAVITRLKHNFAHHGNCLQTGFLGTSILMPVLSENGMNDIAYELLFQRRNPSWMYFIDNAATTIWERWNSYTLDCGIAKGGMTSFNHYAYGCVCEWIWETVAGISCDASDPGFKTIIMKPVPDKRLGWVDAEYNSASGLIRSSWRYEGDIWVWNFTIPEGTTALVTLPGETSECEYGPGNHKVSRLL